MQRIAYSQPICITYGNIDLFLLDYLDILEHLFKRFVFTVRSG